MSTLSAPALESIRSLAPRRSLFRNLYLPLCRSKGVYVTAAFGLLLLTQVFWSQKESHAEIHTGMCSVRQHGHKCKRSYQQSLLLLHLGLC